jgi:hypothetical protein
MRVDKTRNFRHLRLSPSRTEAVPGALVSLIQMVKRGD